MAINDKTFSKIVVAKHSPKNGCHAPEGAVLIVEPLSKLPQKTVVQHSFAALLPKKFKSKYGWVKDVAPFTLEHFIKANFGERGVSDEQRNHLNVMLESIQSMPDGTPVTADYKSRGVIERMMQITVHKVMFYES